MEKNEKKSQNILFGFKIQKIGLNEIKKRTKLNQIAEKFNFSTDY